MGILAEHSQQNLEKIVFEAFDYLINKLNIPLDDIRIRINSKDKDLFSSIEQVDKRIIREIDTFDKKYYTHKYGNNIDGITGRNFNIGIRKKGTDNFFDIGNVIVMESDRKKRAIEMGFGNQTLSMTYFGVDSTIAGSRMADIYSIDSVEKMKFADAMVTTSILQNEGISKDAQCSHYFKRLLKQYYGGVINYWKEKLQVNDKQILGYLDKFIFLEYKNQNFKGINTWIIEN